MSETNIKEMTTEQIAHRLGYKRVGSFQALWEQVCPECLPPLPDRIPAISELKKVLSVLSEQKQGRAAVLCRNAADLLFEVDLDKAYSSGLFEKLFDGRANNLGSAQESDGRYDDDWMQTFGISKPAGRADIGKVIKLSDVSEPQKPETSTQAPEQKQVSKQDSKQPANPEKTFQYFQNLTALDAVYLIVICTGVYSLYFFLNEIGIALGAVYALISYHAMRMAKSRKSQSTASAGIVAVVVLEALGSFAHFSMFNLRIFQAAKAGVLPFDAWQNPETPATIALVISAFVGLSGVYCVWVTHAQTREKVNAEQFEQAHGVAY